jgi:CheY-like chemotaxis protein
MDRGARRAPSRQQRTGVRVSGVSCAVSKILVIEDSKPVSTFLRRCLEKAGYEVEEWLPRSELDIPHHLKTSAPDLILTDYFMPGLSGAAVARHAYATPRRIPVIVLTALREEETIARLLRLGVRRVLNKPIEAEVLLQALRDALAGPTKPEPIP